MGRAGEVKIKPFSGEDFTCITFQPDLAKFKMQALDRDTVALMTRRAYDIAGSSKGVRVFLNGTKLPVSNVQLNLSVVMPPTVKALYKHPLHNYYKANEIYKTIYLNSDTCLNMSG